MPTIKIKFRPSTIEGKEGSLFYQIIHKEWYARFVQDTNCFPTNGIIAPQKLFCRYSATTEETIC